MPGLSTGQTELILSFEIGCLNSFLDDVLVEHRFLFWMGLEEEEENT